MAGSSMRELSASSVKLSTVMDMDRAATPSATSVWSIEQNKEQHHDK